MMVFIFAVLAAIFFLIVDQILQFGVKAVFGLGA